MPWKPREALRSALNADGGGGLAAPALGPTGFPALPKRSAEGFVSAINTATAANAAEGFMRFLDFHFFFCCDTVKLN